MAPAPHGVIEPTLKDRPVKQGMYRARDAFDAIGRNNAARHMHHFLGNSGTTLQIDPARMKADMAPISGSMDRQFDAGVRDVALAEVRANYRGKPLQFQIETPWKSTYATEDMSADWYYAVGDFSFAHTAEVTVTPGKDGSAHVHIESNLHVFDRYNWDPGKSAAVGGKRQRRAAGTLAPNQLGVRI